MQQAKSDIIMPSSSCLCFLCDDASAYPSAEKKPIYLYRRSDVAEGPIKFTVNEFRWRLNGGCVSNTCSYAA